MEDLLNASTYQLGQMALCASFFSEAEYARPLDVFSGSSVGMHLRHTIEFYQHLLSAVAEGHAAIDYDTRQRNHEIEQSPVVATAAIAQIIHYLPAIGQDVPLVLAFACGEQTSYIPTTLSRELCYNLEHCIHHLAIVKVGIRAHFPEKTLPADFGLAYATKKHLQKKKLDETALVGETHKI